MHREALLLPFLLVALAEASSAGSQSPAPKPALPGGAGGTRFVAHATRRDPSVLEFDAPGDGSLWVRGANYKAGFTSAGASVHPALGAEVESRPLAMRPVSLSSGGRPVAFDASVSPSRAGAVFTYDRGSFLERYEAAPESIEQSFLFASSPGAGELVLRIATETVLEARANGEGLRFESDEGGLGYARAQAFDAGGRTRALETRFESGGIEIRVPAEFIASARFPLVIDPVIATFPVDVTTDDDFAPDVAYDATTDRYFVCYEETFSASDHDVYERMFDAAGNILAGGYVDSTGTDWRHPRCANNGLADQFAVVAQTGVAPSRTIWSRVIAAGTNTMGNQTAVNSASALFDQVDPDIGGDPAETGTSTSYLIAWEFVINSTGDRDIVQNSLHTNGLPDSGTPTCIECASGSRNFRPAVSKTSGQGPLAHRWNVVWEYEYSPADHDIYGIQQANGLALSPPYPIDASGLDDHNPSVSSFLDGAPTPGNYMVVFDRQYASDKDLYAHVFNGQTDVAQADLSALEGFAFLTQNQTLPAVDSDGCGFTVAYSELYSTSSTDWDVYASSFGLAGSSIEPIEVHQNLAFSSNPEVQVQVTASRGAAGRRNFATWTYQFAGNNDVNGGTYEAPLFSFFCVPGVDGVATCPCANPPAGGMGCNNSAGTGGASMTVSGTPSLSADTLTLSQAGELGTSVSVVLQGDARIAAGAVFGGGVRCTGGSLKRLFIRAASGGAVTAPIAGDPSISAMSALLGAPIPACGTRFYQIYYRDPNLGFCAAGFNVGNAVRAIWAP
jgi:hypothetical protein